MGTGLKVLLKGQTHGWNSRGFFIILPLEAWSRHQPCRHRPGGPVTNVELQAPWRPGHTESAIFQAPGPHVCARTLAKCCFMTQNLPDSEDDQEAHGFVDFRTMNSVDLSLSVHLPQGCIAGLFQGRAHLGKAESNPIKTIC